MLNKRSSLALLASVCLFGAVSSGLVVAGNKTDGNVFKQVGVMAPGWGNLRFDPPPAGSYELPPLGLAADIPMVLSDGSKRRLSDFYANDKLTILSFIYVSCDDVNGCPMATFVMQKVKYLLNDRPQLATDIQLLTVSFDPENDTPEVMRHYGKDFQSETLSWTFAGVDPDQPERVREGLRAYGQSIVRGYSEEGESRIVAHILKAFLIDKRGQLRNIYGVDFLHPDVLLADAETLVLEEQSTKPVQ